MGVQNLELFTVAVADPEVVRRVHLNQPFDSRLFHYHESFLENKVK